MDQKEWKASKKFKGKHRWYNKTRKIQKSLQYNEDPKARVIHHLRDTEEQRTYNDTYYEFWGFNQDGEDHPFYGEHHTDESRRKISKALSGDKHPRFGKKGKDCPIYGRKLSEETKKKISEGTKGKCAGEKHPGYGKPAWNRGKSMSDESIEKMSAITKPRFAEMSIYYKEYSKNGGTIKWQQFQKYFNEYKRSPVNHSTDDFINWINS